MHLNKKTVVCVVGLGYVGLPLFLSFSKIFKTIGYDVNKRKIHLLKKNNNFDPCRNILTDDPEKISLANFVIVCLPTPISKKKRPDISILKNATKIIGQNIKKKNNYCI